MKNKKSIIVIVAMLAVVAAFFGVYILNKPKTNQGAKEIAIEVIDNEAKTTTYDLNTNAIYLKEALDELSTSTDFSYEGEVSDYGIMINTINNVTADYNIDGSYWAIYVNGEYGQYGADQQPVSDGDTYSFKYEK